MANIALSVVHPGMVSYDWHQSVIKTLTSGHRVSLISVQSGTLIARARNKVLELFLGTDADYLLSTDSDNVWEPGVVDLLLAPDVPIVSGLYYGKGSEGEFPVVTMREGHSLVRPSVYELERLETVDNLVEVAGVGMGCCLIKREVIEALTPIKTLYPYAEKMWGKEAIGEDVAFCLSAAKKGYKSYLKTDARVGHVKQVTI